MLDFPIIETKRLVLKNVTNAHVNEVFHHFSNDAVHEFVDFEPAKNISDAEDIINWGQRIYKNRVGI
jgi:ribosomal-protein-alanine N-acetyltransferase